MYNEKSDSQEMIDAVYDWKTSTNNDGFDTSFLDSIQEALIKYGQLTSGQHKALVNICIKFKIGELQ